MKLNGLFYSIWDQHYNGLRNTLKKKKDIAEGDFASLGVLYKGDHLSIGKKIVELLSKKATEYNIALRYGREDNLTHWFEKDYYTVEIEGLPVKCEEQFLLAKALYALSDLQKKYIQTVFDYFQKNGTWPMVIEVSKDMGWTDIPAIIESLPNSLQRKDHQGETCKLTLYGFFHCQNSEVYKKGIEYIVKMVQNAIEENPKIKSIKIKDIPGYAYAGDKHKEEIFYLLGEPFGGISYSIEGLIIDAPKNPIDIINFTDPVLFVRSYYIRWDSYYEAIQMISINSMNKHVESEQFSFMWSKQRRKAAELYFVQAEDAFNANSAFCALVFYGATLECILLDVLLKNRKRVEEKVKQKVGDMNFEHLIKAARKMKFISSPSMGFSHSLRLYRNFIHPARLLIEKEPKLEDAAAARQLLQIIMAELKAKRSK